MSATTPPVGRQISDCASERADLPLQEMARVDDTPRVLAEPTGGGQVTEFVAEDHGVEMGLELSTAEAFAAAFTAVNKAMGRHER